MKPDGVCGIPISYHKLPLLFLLPQVLHDNEDSNWLFSEPPKCCTNPCESMFLENIDLTIYIYIYTITHWPNNQNWSICYSAWWPNEWYILWFYWPIRSFSSQQASPCWAHRGTPSHHPWNSWWTFHVYMMVSSSSWGYPLVLILILDWDVPCSINHPAFCGAHVPSWKHHHIFDGFLPAMYDQFGDG